MMQVMSPTYTMRVTIKDSIMGDKAIYNGLTGKTGCDEMVSKVKAALGEAGLAGAQVSLERFEHT